MSSEDSSIECDITHDFSETSDQSTKEEVTPTKPMVRVFSKSSEANQTSKSMSNPRQRSRTMKPDSAVLSWGRETGAIPKRNSFNAKHMKSSSIMEKLTKSFDQVSIIPGREVPGKFPEAAVLKQRKKTKSEPAKKLLDSSAYNRRIRPHVPLAKDCKYKANGKSRGSNNSGATKRLLSARKLKIDDLRNHICDLERQLIDEDKEKKFLQGLVKRQQKELEKVERSNIDIPELEKAHDNEARAMKTLMRKLQEKNRDLELRINTKDEELQQSFKLCQKLRVSLQQKNRVEGESEKRVNALKTRIQKQELLIKELRENIHGLERKLSGERLGHESTRVSLKTLKKRYEGVKRRSYEKSKSRNPPTVETKAEKTEKPKETKKDARGIPNISNDSPAAKCIGLTLDAACSEELFPLDSQSPDTSDSVNLALMPFMKSEARDQESPKNSCSGSGEAVNERMCSSAGPLRRYPFNYTYAEDDSMDAPLIIPSSAPRQSTTESDSSSYHLPSQPDALSYVIHKAHEMFQGNSARESQQDEQKDR